MARKKDKKRPITDTSQQDFLEIILDSVADGVFTIDKNFRITSINRAAENILGFTREEAIGKPCRSVFRASICPDRCALRQTMETGSPIVDKHIDVVNREGRTIPLAISTALLKNKEGEMVGGVETFRDLSQLEELRKEIDARYTFEDIISKSHQILRLFSILPDISESSSTVLIQGPSGSGKELFARAIHNLSPRRKKPFLPINCGALPDSLLESELFGYMKGAFTGADKDKPGKIAAADGGTLFLDEIGDTSPAFQVKLLRFLETNEYSPLGSTALHKSNVRTLAATHQDLNQLIRQGTFRQDLFYRLNVISLTLPSLKERSEDIPLLVDHIIKKLNMKMEKHVSGVSNEVMAILMRHDFPGNIRELENILEHAMVLCQGGRIQTEHLPDFLSNRAFQPGDSPKLEEEPLKQVESVFIKAELEKNDWNIAQTARALGIHRTTLWRKIQKYNLKKP